MAEGTLKVGAVQWAPVYHDLAGATDRAIDAIAAAGADNIQLLVFPETWLAGYPYWAGGSLREPVFNLARRVFQDSAVTVPGPEIQRIAEAAGQHKVAVVLGVNERGGSSIYNSQVFINENGQLLGHHRKLVPTATERLVHGRGDGSDLLSHEMAGLPVSGLICFEHQMAPARYLLNSHGVQVHAASWPGHRFLDPIIDASCRQLAHENACFVVVAREIMDKASLPSDFPVSDGDDSQWAMAGGSSIIGPDGSYLVGPVFDDELLVTAELNLRHIDDAKWLIDGVGHYARPDVFQLSWNRHPKPPVVESGE